MVQVAHRLAVWILFLNIWDRRMESRLKLGVVSSSAEPRDIGKGGKGSLICEEHDWRSYGDKYEFESTIVSEKLEALSNERKSE